MAIERMKTNIKGFDELIEGGIPRNYHVMICGLPGTGKTILALEALYRGAVEFSEPALFVAIGEDSEKVIKDQASKFGWDLENTKNFKLYVISVTKTPFDIISDIQDQAKKINAKRIAIDSLTALSINSVYFSRGMVVNLMKTMGDAASDSLNERASNSVIQRFIYLVISGLQSLDSNVFYITDLSISGSSLDGISEYVGDGLILLKSVPLGKDVQRTIQVVKLRSTNISGGIFDIDFTSNGMIVSSE